MNIKIKNVYVFSDVFLKHKIWIYEKDSPLPSICYLFLNTKRTNMVELSEQY